MAMTVRDLSGGNWRRIFIGLERRRDARRGVSGRDGASEGRRKGRR